MGQEQVDRCEDLGHGQGVERGGWEATNLYCEWVPGMAEALSCLWGQTEAEFRKTGHGGPSVSFSRGRSLP